MSNPEPNPDLANLAVLLQLLEGAAFRRAFLSDPGAALATNNVGAVGQQLLDVLADLTYEELRLIGNVGSELRVMLGNDADGFMF